MKFDHIGIFVKNLQFGSKHLTRLFEIKKKTNIIHDPLHKVSVQFFYDKNNICYELVAPKGKKNPVSSILKQNKNILNHVAYKSKNFQKDITKLRKLGCIPLGKPKPARAFKGANIIFFLSPLKIIIEVIEQN